jgi:amino acid transporter
MAILKWLLIVGLAVVGVFALFNGLGTPLPYIKYRGLETYGVPAGLVCLVASIAMAYFWKISATETTTTITTTMQPPR